MVTVEQRAYKAKWLKDHPNYFRDWRNKHLEYKRNQDRLYYRTHQKEIIERALEYQKNHLPTISARSLKRYHEDPEYRIKHSARQKVNNALQSGIIVRSPFCQHCGRPSKTVAHHPDYANPLAITWLCRPCHRQLHFPPPTEHGGNRIG